MNYINIGDINRIVYKSFFFFNSKNYYYYYIYICTCMHIFFNTNNSTLYQVDYLINIKKIKVNKFFFFSYQKKYYINDFFTYL